jgi:hypothetical protein
MTTHRHHQPAGAGAIAAMIFFAGLALLLPLLFWIS